MERRTNQFLLWVVGLLCLTSVSVAQNTSESIPLIQVLNELQQRYDVQFNYDPELVDAVLVPLPKKDLIFSEVLSYLEQNTPLRFQLTNDNIVLITANQTTQRLCGYLYDKDTGKPLVFATIHTKSSHATSNDSGYFTLEIGAPSDVVTISYLGYKTISRPYSEFENSACKPVFMQPDFQALTEVVVSNYITTGINKLADGAYQIDFSKFDILPGLIDTDVLQAVQAFPGIQSSNETVSNINIRGGTHDQNLITWDGIKMYQSGHFFGLISMFNPQITQNVKLTKNGTDVSLTDGVSGTIAMETDTTINDTISGSIGANFIDVHGFMDVPLGQKSSLQIAARKSISDILETPTYSKYFERIVQNTEVQDNASNISNSNQQFDFYDASLRWIYKISDKDLLQLNFLTTDNTLTFNENAVNTTTQSARQSSLRQNSIAGGLRYHRSWNTDWKSSLELYETDYTLRAINANIQDSQRFLQENVVSETSLKLKLNYNISPSLELLWGYHFTETGITNLDDVDNPVFRLLVSEVVRTHGLFSQLHFRSNNRNSYLSIGGRYNYIEKFKKHLFEPRLAFSQRFLDYFSMEILGEFKHQNTSQIINFQNDFLGIEKRRWQLSNDNDIPVITSKQISMGLNFNRKGWLLSTEAYYKDVSGITTQSQGFQNQYEFTRTSGSYNAYGLDVILRKRVQNFNTWLSYTYLMSDYTFRALPEQEFPSNYDIRQSVTFGAAYASERFKISTGLNWHSGKPTTRPSNTTPIVNDTVNFNEANSNVLDDYLRLDASALYNFQFLGRTRAHVGVSVWNILDRNNQINNFYRITNNMVNETLQSSLGLTTNAVFRVHF